MMDHFRDFDALARSLAFRNPLEPLGLVDLSTHHLFRQASLLEDLGKALGSIRQMDLMLGSSPVSSTLSDLGLRQESLRDLLASQIDLGGLRIHSSWTEHLKAADALKGATIGLDACFCASVTRVSELLAISEARLAVFPWDSLGSTLALSQAGRITITSQLTDLARSYGALLGELEGSRLLGLPEVVSALAPVEFYRAVDLVEAITPVEESVSDTEELDAALSEEVEESLPALLEGESPRLVSIWRGARDAVASSNPDRGRHVSVSLRELVTHVLHALPPTERVEGWTSDPNHYHNGRPTRRARLLYICREVHAESFKDFVELDVQAAVEFIDILNRETHRAKKQLEDRHLEAMVVRTDALLLFLLSISS